MNEITKMDVAIIGSGFAGSLLARILQQNGCRVALIDAAGHPRFAIGESSTPIADMLLDRLGKRFGLADLEQMSTYGKWKRSVAQLTCGKKRGFSYFDHRASTSESFPGESSLLVAASPNDDLSDTHWYRAEVDEYWFRLAVRSGVEGIENDAVCDIEPGEPNRIRLASGRELLSRYVIDATGRSAVTAKVLQLPSLVARLQTCSSAAFGHFRNVASYSKTFNAIHGDQRSSVPFDADDAAQHHLVDDGWVWMLRFDNAITSVGWVSCGSALDQHSISEEQFCRRFVKYDSLSRVMKDAKLAAPNRIVSMNRIQSLCDPIISSTCWMLPSTALTLDPLHSTGIAHGLIGVQRVAEMLLGDASQVSLDRYRQQFFREVDHLDRLVACAYRSMKTFSRFASACTLYFLAAIHCEEALQAGREPDVLWLADDEDFAVMIDQAIARLDSDAPDDVVTDQLQTLLQPWNHVGLLDPTVGNRYAYTATK